VLTSRLLSFFPIKTWIAPRGNRVTGKCDGSRPTRATERDTRSWLEPVSPSDAPGSVRGFGFADRDDSGTAPREANAFERGRRRS